MKIRFRFLAEKPDEFDGKFQSFVQMIHPEDRKFIDGSVERYLHAATEVGIEFRVLWPDNSIRYVSSKGQLLVDAEGLPIRMVGLCWNITNEKSLEEQLRQAQKMEAIGQLAGGIAHDFNNLLMVINGYGECLLQEIDESDDRHEEIVEIVNAGKRAAALTKQLLAFSRKQIVQPVILDINTVVSSLEKMLQRLIGEHIEMELHVGPNLNRVKIDPGQLEQILINLIVNARDAMPNGGKTTIDIQNVELSDEYSLNHFDVTPGSYVTIAISDTGIGMTREVKDRIFDPFFTTKEVGKGTGLGLSTVYGIVKQNLGHIWVYSEPGRGTTFKVYFPVCGSVQSDDANKRSFEKYQGTECILVVEDEMSVRKLMERFLHSAGYTVLMAENGEDAIERFGNFETCIHLMITDMVMPKMGGPELASRMRQFIPDLKVLYVSGYTESTLLRNGDIAAGENLLQKPVDSNTLLKKVREILNPLKEVNLSPGEAE